MSQPVTDAQIIIMPDSILVTSNDKGRFETQLTPGSHQLSIFHLQFQTYHQALDIDSNQELTIALSYKTELLQDVRVTGRTYREDITTIRIDAKNLENVPSATGDFTKILSTLPGVSSNNELSSAYSVRGGNYDENLIYVNGIEIYRPQIVSAGRQEGLSFINPDLVGAVDFSAGGWEAAYGDKLSSVLSVQYKEPTRHEASINLSILGGSVYFGGINQDKSLTYTISVRHKNTKYLLGTLETQGQYLPKFTDVQSYINKKFKNNKTELGLLISTAINNYQTIPTYQQTEFGNLQASYRLSIAFDGRELLDYYTNQAALLLRHRFSDRFQSSLSLSGVRSSERENYEIEAGYLLCDVNTNLASNRFNECVNVLGVGTNYSYGRNRLEAQIVSVDQKNELKIGNQLLQFGMTWDHQEIDDRLKEYEFIDSADYVTITETLDNQAHIRSDKVAGYAQLQLRSSDQAHHVNIGVRASYWSYSGQVLVTPRLQYAYSFGDNQKNTLRAAAGLYAQHPFYRELRDRDGNINPDVKAQESVHTLLAWDRHFQIWGRPFMFSTEGYYKYMWNVNPYDVENVKIRYFATNQATAYAYGLDFRINGEFIEGTESWFSFGVMKTEEDIKEGYGYVRRPTDQRLKLGIFFQDHLPNDPTIKVSLNAQFGSGLPFGPPKDDANRSAFSGDHYTRVDIGFSKSFTFVNDKLWLPKSLWLGAEVLNVLGTDNALTYTWVRDVNNNQFAVPNALSARFLNVRLIAKFHKD
ncbi:TonB-dependent receptor plug domain-containing protein [Reichenbachiella agarivorans]|uniref:TonB-dependent receptor plug domain-containing protein n=1 Tax=Reichenbachiella agarivorans TaxID=2979464 RepID=A0ABY6CM40_9BACT|nr:TonB-dependent receptor plug domain-containing protein [Reichenbachiella agarivorans]UXP31584.1 TonB-dependent receptor plug domain-containing protein [Reichenbachiella agarivorans]